LFGSCLIYHALFLVYLIHLLCFCWPFQVREVGIARSNLDRLSLVVHRFFDENEDKDGEEEEDENDNENKVGGGSVDDYGGGYGNSSGGGKKEPGADLGQRLLTRVALAEATLNELKVRDTKNVTKDVCQGKQKSTEGINVV
jgi:hypothetical protein